MGVVETERKLKALKEKLRYSKNPLEQRNIRSNIGKLEKQLVMEKKMENK